METIADSKFNISSKNKEQSSKLTYTQNKKAEDLQHKILTGNKPVLVYKPRTGQELEALCS